MSFSKVILIGLGLFAISAVLVGVNSTSNQPAIPAELGTNQIPYSEKGPFQIGYSTEQISAQTSLEIKVWYPGLTNTTDNSISYDYEVKMQKPFGRVSGVVRS